MPDMTLAQAQSIVDGALRHASGNGFQPLLVLVLDRNAAPKACAAQDGASRGRFDIARGKANGALAMGMGSRTLAARAAKQPHLYASFLHVLEGGLVAGPGGVLVRDAGGEVLGAVGISGDTGDNDERAAIAGIIAAQLTADPGQD